MDSTDHLPEPTDKGHYDRYEVPSIGSLEARQSNRIGDCHIFNFETYDEKMKLKVRDGSQEDVKKLKEVFSDLNFNVEDYKDLSDQMTLEAISKAAKNVTADKYLVCCILTHGNDLDQVATQNQWLYLEDILPKCSDIIGKNKIIFIIQACRSNELKLEKLQTIESTESGCDTQFYSDVLVARSTYPDTVSMRRPNCGSYFIQEVCHALTYLKEDLNLFEVFTVVNFTMAYFFQTCIHGKIGGQMPVFYSSLTSEILLNNRNRPEKPFENSLLGKKLLERGFNYSLDLNSISKLKYDFAPDKVNFFKIHIKHDKLPEIKRAAATLSRKLMKRDFPHIKPVEVSKTSEFKKILKENAKKKADLVFYLISGVSSAGSLSDSKGGTISQRNIIDRFVEKQKSDLISKPKIFLFLMFEPVSKPSSPVESLETGDSCDADESCYIAQHADILEINILVKSDNDMDIHKPVKAFEEQLKASHGSQNFLSTLTKVNSALVQKQFFSNNENNFHFNSTLTKKLFY